MNSPYLTLCEESRLVLQAQLDSQKTSTERNIAGQFATPTALAREVVGYGLSLLPQGSPVRFMDPAFGTGSFYSALRATVGTRPVESVTAFEIDPHYGIPSREFWIGSQLDLQLADFTLQSPSVNYPKPNFLVCNPPYSRHHHLSAEEKDRLHALSLARAGVKLSRLAGLYVHFLAIAHDWLAPDGIAAWLIPSEFMDVNFGREIKKYLLRDVELLHIHRFDPNDVQFDDALVSSAVVYFRNRRPPLGHAVRFSYGGTLLQPAIERHVPASELKPQDKWTRYPREETVAEHTGYRIKDLFDIRRGLATGNNDFFILPEERVVELKLPSQFLRPILPSSRYIKADEISADTDGVPLLEKRLFLIDCDLPESVLQFDYPELWSYLESGLETVATGYLCKNRKRWYIQEKRGAAPIVCTYMGRSDNGERPFRFILNNSKATATNGFLLMYPTPLLTPLLAANPSLLREIWAALNQISPETLMGNGRVYGGGMHKMEPKELANVPADALASIAGLQ